MDLSDAILARESGGYPALEAMRTSKDILEGIKAFAQKCQPEWVGE